MLMQRDEVDNRDILRLMSDMNSHGANCPCFMIADDVFEDWAYIHVQLWAEAEELA